MTRIALDAMGGDKAPGEPYPLPPEDVYEKVMASTKVQERLIAPFNMADLVQKLGATHNVALDGTWQRVSGSVVCATGTDENARVTFRITTDYGKVIFERVGQKGKDAPQIVEVNIPADAKSLDFTFTQEGSVEAVGIWKNLRLVK